VSDKWERLELVFDWSYVIMATMNPHLM